jgi:serine/threonine-protein kinase SRPK3
MMLQINNQSIIDSDYIPDTMCINKETELAFLYWPNNEADRSKPHLDTTHPSKVESLPLQYHYLGQDPTPDDLCGLNIALSDWGVSSWVDNHLLTTIQPELLRAPEVIIGAPWGPPADIWNLGAITVELLERQTLFNGSSAIDGYEYATPQHLWEMTDLLGPFPKTLLEKGRPEIVGRLFTTDEPGFKDGTVKGANPYERAPFDDWITCVDGDDRLDFYHMLRGMMCIDPEERMTARELLEQAWLKDVEL